MAAHIIKKCQAQLLSTLLLALVSTQALANSEESSECTDSSSTCTSSPSRAITLDASHTFMTNRFDSVARWFDGFFGDLQEEREAATSIVRLRYSYEFAEAGETDDKLRIRGKVDLPELDKRLKLVFSDEGDPGEELFQAEELSEEDSRSVALQYDARRTSKLRVENRLGISSRKFKASSRVRYRHNFSESWRTTLSEEVFWLDGLGFGSRSVIDFDHLRDRNNLSRWRTQIDYNEESQGVEWLTRLTCSRSFDREHAVKYFVEVGGYTRPDYQTGNYGVGVTYRQKFIKRWLFAEVEPRYFWDYDDEADQREGIASIFLRLEVVFSEKYKN